MADDSKEITARDVAPLPASTTTPVKCEKCGTEDTILTPPSHLTDDEPSIEARWQCANPDCKHTNLIEGHPGPPGEGAFGAAGALSDDEVLAAAVRRGLIVGGQVTPAGDAALNPAKTLSGGTAPAGQVTTPEGDSQ